MKKSAFLSIDGVRKEFGGLVALEEVTLDVYEGELLGLIGPNGAGKSTLLNVITSIYPATDGRIFYNGDEITAASTHELANQGIVRTFQESKHFNDISGYKNIQMAEIPNNPLNWRAFVSGLFEDKGVSNSVSDAIEEIGLSASQLRRTPSNMNHVEQIQLSIARAMAKEPSLLLLDEPFAGLTKEETDMVSTIITQLTESGITVLLIDHDVGKVAEIADRVALLDQGEILLEGDPKIVINDKRTQDAYFGE